MNKEIKFETEFFLAELPAKKSERTGEKLERINYCEKRTRRIEQKEQNGKKVESVEEMHVFLNYDAMLQQILMKYGIN